MDSLHPRLPDLGSWLQLIPAPSVVAIREVNKWIDLSVSVSIAVPFKYIKLFKEKKNIIASKPKQHTEVS